MKIIFLSCSLIYSNFALSQNVEYTISDIRNSEKTEMYLRNTPTCELLNFMKTNIKAISDKTNEEETISFFNEISKRTNQKFIITSHSKNGQILINQIRESQICEIISKTNKNLNANLKTTAANIVLAKCGVEFLNRRFFKFNRHCFFVSQFFCKLAPRKKHWLTV